ncbi:DUF3081 domain-containing protein [Colwellia sp. D2M02]|uniref:DUF3081 domain-containing protein n=1 Tax=Colwellia asteriadis TaxID=517723 RepID=A0ABP3WKF8_9GAMM|nr:DUF3081 family protein [Colwellia sp. D2M02]MBU2892821.1 DUF3081 domain-containing protein [Colwellia sp. D2M02]
MHQPQLSLKQYLKAFNIITSKGDKSKHRYCLDNVDAWHDFDGYTCFLGYKDLTLTLLFHGRYAFDYQHEETLTAFLALLTEMLKDNRSD